MDATTSVDDASYFAAITTKSDKPYQVGLTGHDAATLICDGPTLTDADR